MENVLFQLRQRLKPAGIIFVSAVIGISSSAPAYALGQVSRACSVAELRNSTTAPIFTAAILFLKAISDMTPATFYQLQNQYANGADAAYWVVLESITTDYGEERYYLYAKSEAVQLVGRSFPEIRGEEFFYTPAGSFTSSGWRSDRVDPSLAADPSISFFMANRKWLYSARAGEPTIFSPR